MSFTLLADPTKLYRTRRHYFAIYIYIYLYRLYICKYIYIHCFPLKLNRFVGVAYEVLTSRKRSTMLRITYLAGLY
jgi:hypothetical protein